MKYNTIIIGGGVAGLTAALYLGRANKSCLILEGKFWGGQTAILNKVENYPGLVDVEGFDIANALLTQVKTYQVEMKVESVIDLSECDGVVKVVTTKAEYLADNIVVATGAKTGVLNLNNEKKFMGRGVSYCATCDGNFFKNKPVALFGIGATAVEDIKYLNGMVSKLYWIIPDRRLSNQVLSEVSGLANVEILYSSQVSELFGEDTLKSINIYDMINKREIELEVDGLFVSLGRQPDTSWLNLEIKKNKGGYIVVDKNCQTSHKGVFACGDITSRDLKQIVTACSDGAIAASYIIKN